MQENKTYNKLDDSKLIRLIRENDNEAYKVLLERYSGMIRAIVAKYADTSNGDDLTQEANISFYYATQFFDFQSSSFKTFSSVCVERGVLAVLKKNTAQKRIPANLIVSLNDDEVLNVSDSPENLIIEKESGERVMFEIEKRLSKLELTVLKSYLLTGSYDRTAEELMFSRQSVDIALLRVRKKLDGLK